MTGHFPRLSRVCYTSNMTTASGYKNCALFPPILIMDTARKLCTLKDVPSFLGVYPSDILPPSITRSATLILNTYPHTAKWTHWLAIHLQPRFYTGYFSILKACRHSSLIYCLSYATRAPSGNTKRPSCKDGPGQFAANTAVYSHFTWITGTLLNSLCASSMPPTPNGRPAAYSRRSSDHFVRRVAKVMAALHL